jgi:capsular exopolysaccharide synthesis family protein
MQWYSLRSNPLEWSSEGRMIVTPHITAPGIQNVYTEEFENFMGTQMALMDSPSVRNRVDARLQGDPLLHPSPVDLHVSLTPKSSIFNLQAIGKDPAYTQAYLKMTMEEFINLKREMAGNEISGTELTLTEKLKHMAADIQKGKEELLNYQASNNLIFLQPNGENSAAENLANLRRQLDEQKSELQLLKNLDLDQNLEHLREMAQQPGKGNNPPPAQTADPKAVSNASLDAMPASLGPLEQNYLDTKRELKLLNAELQATLKLGLSTNSKAVLEYNKQIAAKDFELESLKEQSEEQLKHRQHVLEIQIKSLQDQVKTKEDEALDASRKMAVFNGMKDAQQRLQKRYEDLQADVQTLDMGKGLQQESVTILEEASAATPLPLEGPKRMVMAELIGLAIGLGLMLFLDRLDDRPRTYNDLEKLFNVPILGQIPYMKRHEGAPILQLEDERYPLIEASHSLRSALLYGKSFQDGPKSIVIGSARPSDGKSVVSSNFAITLAQTGARVLLIDADMRRGVLHEHFGANVSPGLSEVLAGESAWADAIVQTDIPNLHLLPCGNPPRNPGILFAQAAQFIQEVGGQYDYCLFDTTPVLVADDVLSLAPQTDGVLMVVRAGFTSGRIAQAALNLLYVRKVKVLGLVFNAVNTRTGNYYYYRHKDYYRRRK